MATYLIPFRRDDGEMDTRTVRAIPKSGYYLLTAKPVNGKDAICTGVMRDGTRTHNAPSSAEFEGSLTKHHGAWCNATREHMGAPLRERAASRTKTDPNARRNALWAAAAEAGE